MCLQWCVRLWSTTIAACVLTTLRTRSLTIIIFHNNLYNKTILALNYVKMAILQDA